MVLASDPEWLCGVDVAAPGQLHFATHMPLMERMRMLRGCFSDSEVKSLSHSVWRAPTPDHLNAHLQGCSSHPSIPFILYHFCLHLHELAHAWL